MLYVERNYGDACFIVFDSYGESSVSTKGVEQKRRSRTRAPVEVIFDEFTSVTIQQADFMAHNGNKQRLVHMLLDSFLEKGHIALQANDDADVLICSTAMLAMRMKKK